MVVEPVNEEGELWGFGSQTVIGELRDEKTDSAVGNLVCRVTDKGTVLIDFPEKEAGVYVFVVDVVSKEGESVRLMDGFVTYLEPKAVYMARGAGDTNVLRVFMDGDSRRCVWNWSTEAERMYLQAKGECEKAAQSALEAAESAKSVNEDVRVELLEEVKEQLDVFDKKVTDAIVVNKATNTWKIGGVVTDTPVTGESGKSPQISTHGTWLRWDEKLNQWVDTGVKVAGADGKSPYIDANGYWWTWDAGRGVYVNSGVKAEGKDGVDSRSVRRVVVASYEDIPQSGATCNGGYYYYVPENGSYTTYAWFDDMGWVNVSLHGNLASQSDYGLVKLGSDKVVEGGAAVGVRANGCMAVGEATIDEAGVMMYSGETATGGGLIHKGTDGKAYVNWATTENGGAVRVTYAGVVDTACIGLTADGGISVVKAGENTYGVVKAGKYMNYVSEEPYLLESGTIAEGEKEGQHAINLLEGGALKFMGVNTGGNGWDGDTAPGVGTDTLNTSVKFFGLQTNESFSQRDGKLTLNAATDEVLGGVYVSDSRADERAVSVPSMAALNQAIEETEGWASMEFATKADTYTKEEVDDAVEAAYADFKSRLMGELFKTVTEDEYAALTPEPGVLYLIAES